MIFSYKCISFPVAETLPVIHFGRTFGNISATWNSSKILKL